MFLASIGELRPDELDVLEWEAEEARERIDTPSEQIGAGGLDRADRRRVKLWEAVEAAGYERRSSSREDPLDNFDELAARRDR